MLIMHFLVKKESTLIRHVMTFCYDIRGSGALRLGERLDSASPEGPDVRTEETGGRRSDNLPSNAELS